MIRFDPYRFLGFLLCVTSAVGMGLLLLAVWSLLPSAVSR